MHHLQEDVFTLLIEIQLLLELNNENPFKIRAFEKAAKKITDIQDLEDRARAGTLVEIEGIGKSISEILTEFITQGTCPVRDELQKKLPKGLLELTQISGLGPKKAKKLINELEIHSVRELEYACKENRLLKLKGFGGKIQNNIIKEIKRLKSNDGKVKLVDPIVYSETFLKALRQQLSVNTGDFQVSETGEIRRKCEILTKLEYLIGLQKASGSLLKIISEFKNQYVKSNPFPVVIQIHIVDTDVFAYELFKTTGSEEHLKNLKLEKTSFSKEDEIYKTFGLPWISPELRETGHEIELAKQGKLKDILPINGLQGIFHVHTTWSDGSASIENMVKAAKANGFRYIGISDHSQSAFYANGLKPESINAQEKEIKNVQEKYPEIKIFWGIESDILEDGSLDYEAYILKRFDFVIASVHSRFKMDQKQMTERVLNAIRSPYTHFLGHMTGRLLLGREGYALDIEKVITEASKYNVAIELNANPMRLDVDWRYGDLLRKNKTLVCINPDAHSVSGLQDTDYGVWMVRKALLPSFQIINTKDAQAITKWLKDR
ncbi:MAG: PHP domain-containing protein [Deltaproteobacteria bacterium]|nr:PHP domain-containing protein [Deltaproteobacteria bacterium]